MIKVLYRKEITRFLKYHLIFIVSMSTLLIFVLNTILGSGDIIYSLLQFLLVGLGTAYTTSLYKKYSNPNYLKITELHGKSRNRVKFTLFLVMISWLAIITLAYLTTFLIWDYSGLLKSKNSFSSGGTAIWRLEGWTNGHISGFYFGIYAIIITIFIVVLYSAMMNHFIKSKVVILGLNLILTIYVLLFNGITIYEQHAENGFLVSSGYNWRTTLNFIITPWTQVGVMGKVGWFAGIADNPNSSYLLFENVDFWDYSQMGAYSNLIWTPYLTLFILGALPLIIRTG